MKHKQFKPVKAWGVFYGTTFWRGFSYRPAALRQVLSYHTIRRILVSPLPPKPRAKRIKRIVAIRKPDGTLKNFLTGKAGKPTKKAA